jgi:uncharacterized damage-inducible protein DinB
MKNFLLATLQNSETYTGLVAEAMPAKEYNSKPAEPVWNFNELINHIAYGIEWWTDNYIKKTETSWSPPPPKPNKKETIAYLQQAYAILRNAINKEQLTDEEKKGFYATLDHITHHRGQATTYLRSKGITPPEYTY